MDIMTSIHNRREMRVNFAKTLLLAAFAHKKTMAARKQ